MPLEQTMQLSFLQFEDDPEPEENPQDPAMVTAPIVPAEGINDRPELNTDHPWPSGTLFSSPGGHFTYRVVGACCRLFDREELPWPCCRLQWRGKEPSWRRIGRRFVLDIASRNSPAYIVEILELGHHRETIAITLYSVKLSQTVKQWWYTKPKDSDPV